MIHKKIGLAAAGIVMIAGTALALLIAGCAHHNAMTALTCVGKGIILVDAKGGMKAGDLQCTGTCPEKAVCAVDSSMNEHGGKRQWCGCPGGGEPSECHVVKITPGPGEGGGPAFFACAGGCPDGQTCTTDSTVTEKYENGKPKKIIFTCRCK